MQVAVLSVEPKLIKTPKPEVSDHSLNENQNSETESSISELEPYEWVEVVNLRKRPRKAIPHRSLFWYLKVIITVSSFLWLYFFLENKFYWNFWGKFDRTISHIGINVSWKLVQHKSNSTIQINVLMCNFESITNGYMILYNKNLLWICKDVFFSSLSLYHC